MSNTTKDSNLNESKKLSLESKDLLEKLEGVSLTAAELIPRLYKSLKDDGLKPSEIRGLIEDRIAISQRRLRQLLPLEAKNQRMIRSVAAIVPQASVVKTTANPEIVKILFDPAPIDRDRTQVFIIHFDKSIDKIRKYETVGRRTLG